MIAVTVNFLTLDDRSRYGASLTYRVRTHEREVAQRIALRRAFQWRGVRHLGLVPDGIRTDATASGRSAYGRVACDSGNGLSLISGRVRLDFEAVDAGTRRGVL